MTGQPAKRARKPRAAASGTRAATPGTHAAPFGTRAAPSGTRAELMEQHAAARRRRNVSPLGSDDYRAAAEEIARIEIAIAQLEEQPHSQA